MKNFKHNSTVVTPEPPWNSIRIEMLPKEAFAVSTEREVKAGIGYPHHWIKNGKKDDSGRYVAGKMYLNKGGLIEMYRKAKKDNAPARIIDHLSGHLKEAGISISRNQNRKNFYEGKAGEIKMKNGKLPTIGRVDLNRFVAEIDSARARSGDDIESWELEKINGIARADLKGKEIYSFPFWVSNDQVDSFFTRMDPDTTLQNYVADFNDSRALMLTHAEDIYGATALDRMPLGSTFHSAIMTREDKPGQWVEAWAYIIRDISIGNLKTNDAIRMIQGGVWRRLSVGFTLKAINGRAQGYYLCEICSNKLLSDDCDHLPGRQYDNQLCVARIIGASAREASLAYLNSSPGTVVQKARMLAEDGKLKLEEIESLQMQYGVRFFNIDPEAEAVPGDTESESDSESRVDPGRESETKTQLQKESHKMETIRGIMIGMIGMFSSVMPEGNARRELNDLKHRVEGAEDEAVLGSLGKTLMDSARGVLNTAQKNSELIAALPEEARSIEAIGTLISQAADGDAHRTAAIDTAIAEGIRHEGETFNEDHWRSVLKTQSLDFVRTQGDEWKKLADAKVDPKTRSTDSGHPDLSAPDSDTENREEEPQHPGIPDRFFEHGQGHV